MIKPGESNPANRIKKAPNLPKSTIVKYVSRFTTGTVKGTLCDRVQHSLTAIDRHRVQTDRSLELDTLIMQTDTMLMHCAPSSLHIVITFPVMCQT